MNAHLETKRLTLRSLGVSDITQEYIDWLNNPEITKYLEIRHTPQTYEAVCAYILSFQDDMLTKRYWGIFEKKSQTHIGSITLNYIHPIYKTTDISFVIGHPLAQGKGFASEAVHVICDYAFSHMDLHKITGGHYASHTGSRRVFEKNGFVQECVQREQYINYRNEREDAIRYGLLAKEFIKQTQFFE